MSLPLDRIAALQDWINGLSRQLPAEADQRALADLSGLLEALAGKDLVTRSDALEEKARYVSHVSHELRVPMTSIKGYADILQKGMAGDLNDQQQEFLTVITQNLDRMSALIADLRDIAHLETGRTQFDLAETAPVYCIRTAVSNVRAAADQLGRTVAMELPESLPLIMADAGRVIQVLGILLRNAVMYSHPGSTVTTRALTLENAVRFEVQDNGNGISGADRPHIFEQFFRSDDAHVREHSGWGLGLHLAKQLVTSMGGSIEFKTETGMGSTFSFTLPVD